MTLSVSVSQREFLAAFLLVNEKISLGITETQNLENHGTLCFRDVPRTV